VPHVVAGAKRCPALFGPPRLHPQRIPRLYDEVREPAAALGATEAQILDWHIAASRIDDGPQVGRRPVKAGMAPDGEAQPGVLGQHAAGGRKVSHLETFTR
jgi:hypothetical protein